MKIKSGVYFRYEPKVGDGTTYIYDINTNSVYKTSEFVYNVLDQIRDKERFEEIADNIIHLVYYNHSFESVVRAINKTIVTLKEMDVIY